MGAGFSPCFSVFPGKFFPGFSPSEAFFPFSGGFWRLAGFFVEMISRVFPQERGAGRDFRLWFVRYFPEFRLSFVRFFLGSSCLAVRALSSFFW